MSFLHIYSVWNLLSFLNLWVGICYLFWKILDSCLHLFLFFICSPFLLGLNYRRWSCLPCSQGSNALVSFRTFFLFLYHGLYTLCWPSCRSEILFPALFHLLLILSSEFWISNFVFSVLECPFHILIMYFSSVFKILHCPIYFVCLFLLFLNKAIIIKVLVC